MTVTAFATNTETGLAGAAADLLAKDATFDDATINNENAQILTWTYMLVKVIRARQGEAVGSGVGSAVDRVFGFVGPHSRHAFMVLTSMIDELYNEFFVAFNSVDAVADDPWGSNLGTVGTGPVGGPIE